MENLTDKNIRGELIARYLEAETDAREEMLLAEYFAEHAPEADETAVARLLLAERPEALLAAGERASTKFEAPASELLGKARVTADELGLLRAEGKPGVYAAVCAAAEEETALGRKCRRVLCQAPSGRRERGHSRPVGRRAVRRIRSSPRQ